jgi:signal transduction histidine kinase
MMSPVTHGRIAPIALLIAFVFVVVGFFRADRDMRRAERDRAELTLSETATRVEAFVLRRVIELQAVAASIERDPRDPGKRVLSVAAHRSFLQREFDYVWTVDSLLRVGTLGTSASVTDSIRADPRQLANINWRDGTFDEPAIGFVKRGDNESIFFVVPLPAAARERMVGVVSVDSLARLLRANHSNAAFSVVVTTPSDTVVVIPSSVPNVRVAQLSRPMILLNQDMWAISISYIPTGRGVRIALWIVGFSAIVGLGIGLVLERREANRIADRSSELEHLSAELLRANRAKSEFLANVSHELRTPLNAIVGFVDLLRDGVYGPLNSRQVGPVERIEASANHLRHLVDQVLDLAKMAAGRLEVHTEPIELRPFVFDVASEVEPLMTEKGLSFSLAVGASLPRVRTDPTHLRQILVNLLGNAAKFTTNGGISIRGKLVKRDDPAGLSNGHPGDSSAALTKSEVLWIALQVADSGIGISDKDRERIFDEFEQVNAGPRGDSIRRGTGLGLSISRRLARLLGGDITVESELGRGSVFTVWLPVERTEATRSGNTA